MNPPQVYMCSIIYFLPCWSCDSQFVSLFRAMHGLGHLSCVTHPSMAVSSPVA